MVPAITAAVAALVILVVAGVAITTYNRLVALSNLCDNGFAQIDVQLRRRYDLIPNLVECVKAYMSHESETLEKVIAARNQAKSSLDQAAKNPADGQSMQNWLGAEGALSGALGKMSFVMEAYPDLKANENVASLTEELSSTENRIAFARQAYNDWIMGFNSYRESFPAIAFAGMLGYAESRAMLEIEDRAAVQEAPVVSLT